MQQKKYEYYDTKRNRTYWNGNLSKTVKVAHTKAVFGTFINKRSDKRIQNTNEGPII